MIKKIAFVLVGLTLPFTFAACGAESGSSNEPETPRAPYDVEDIQNSDGKKYQIESGYRDVYEFRLDDGTRCVASSHDGGFSSVDCDWDNPTEPVEESEFN